MVSEIDENQIGAQGASSGVVSNTGPIAATTTITGGKGCCNDIKK